MLKRIVQSGVALGIIVVVGLGCDPVIPATSPVEPITLEHGDAQSNLLANLHQTMTHFNDRFAFLEETDLKDITVGIFKNQNDCPPSFNGLGDPCPGPDEAAVSDVTRLRDGLIEVLQERVLLASQLESEPVSKKLVYRLDPGLQCDGKNECIQFFTDHPVRVSVESFENHSYEVSLSLGPNNLAPVAVKITAEELSVTAYLAETAQVLAIINTYLGDDSLPTFSQAEGVVRAKMSYISDEEAQLDLDVLESVHFSVLMDDQPMSVTMGAGEVVAIANSLAKTLGALVFVGPTDVTVSGSMIEGLLSSDDCATAPLWKECEQSAAKNSLPGVFELALGGVTAHSLLQAGDNSIYLTGLGLGSRTTTLSYDGAELASVDINPDDGRTFDLTLSVSEPQESLQMLIRPRLDAWVRLNFAPLLNKLDTVPSWMLGDELNIVFEDAQSALAELKDGWLSIVTGKMVLTSSAMNNNPIIIPAGMCLGMEGPDSEQHSSLLQSMIVDQCVPGKVTF